LSPNAPYSATTRRQFRAAWFALTPVTVNGLMFNLRFRVLATGNTTIKWDEATPGNCEFADEFADVIPNVSWINSTVVCGASGPPPCTPPTATITAAGNTTFCQGGSVVLNANTGTGLTYQWSLNGSSISGATNASYTANAAGSYTVTVFNSATCSTVSAATSVTVTTPPSAGTLSGTQSICATGTTTFSSTVSGGSWSSSATGVATVNASTGLVTGVAAGNATITYTVTGTGGCANATATRTVTVTPSNTITLSSAAGSNAQTLTLGAAITNITYTTTGASGATFSGLPAGVSGAWAANTATITGTPTAAGTYNYTVAMTGGCTGGTNTATGSIIVNAPAGPNIATTIGAVSGCIGDTVSVPVTINMASGISTAAISMAIGYDPTKLQCLSTVTSLNSNISAGFLSNCGVFSGASQFRAAWFNLTPVAFNGLMFNMRFKILAAGTHTLAWDLATPGNCEYADEFADVIPNTTWNNGTVSLGAGCNSCIPPVATITAAGNTTFCQGGSVVLNANTGTGLTYQWSLNGSSISGATNASYTANAAGSYIVTVFNAATCSTISSATNVTVNNPSTAAISASICQGQTYAFGSQNLSSAGTYNRTVTAANGCDSVI
ncbi:MAG: cohesin domain-containing protein, partial [Bacteroidota bacterium]